MNTPNKNKTNINQSPLMIISISLLIGFILGASSLYLLRGFDRLNVMTNPITRSILKDKSQSEQFLSEDMKVFCDENTSVMLCDNGYVELRSKLPGGGSTYLNGDEKIICPVVDPKDITQQCRAILNSKLICDKVICSESN